MQRAFGAPIGLPRYILLAAKGRARNCTTCTKGDLPCMKGAGSLGFTSIECRRLPLKAQATKRFEVAQDEYLEVMPKFS